MKQNNSYRTMVLILLTVVYSFNFIDRQIVGILAPFIQQDLNLTNTQLGLLTGFYFALFYTFVAIPIAWLADRFNRVNIVSIALATWSGFTALFGLAGNYLQISLARMGVGIGEAGGSPPSHSIISDLYSKEERASALGVYSMGIPFGVMAAYLVTASLIGSSSDAVDWRRIFVILGLAGIALALVVRLVIRATKGKHGNGASRKGKAATIFRVIKNTSEHTVLVGHVFWNCIWILCCIRICSLPN